MDEQLQQETPAAAAPLPKTEPKALVNTLAIPVAIIVGFGLIAAAIFFSGSAAQTAKTPTNAKTPEEATVAGPVRPVDAKDHIRGNPNAPIVIVEYSDFDCPFCKNFHETMNKVMSKY